MAILYGPHYETTWRDALILPGHDDMLESLASEVADYYKISPQAAVLRMREAWDERSETMHAEFGRRRSKEDVLDYYRLQQHGVLVSMYWHSLQPDRWALNSVAALHNVFQFAGGRRVFEFGHGVGSTGILFATHGFEVTLGDVSPAYRDFARYRLARRGLACRLVDLTQEAPSPESYDVVVSLDVIEHIPNPLPELQRLWGCLRPGGVMALGICFGKDPAMPEHVLHYRLGVLDRIRALGLERVPATPLLVYYKREISATRKAFYRFQDFWVALVEDLNALGVPLVWRLARTAVPPPFE